MPKRDWRFADESLTTVVKREGRGGRALGRVKGRGMNKSETAYAEQLRLRMQVGEVLWWMFEGMKFNLGENCFLTPDFNVLLASGELQCIDVKGTQTRTDSKGAPYEAAFYEDDARVKIATAARMFPISFLIAFLGSDGNWIVKEVGQ